MQGRFAVDMGYQIRRIPFCEVLSFIKSYMDVANSYFSRLLESVNGSSKIKRDRRYQKVKTKFERANATSAYMVKIGTRPGGTNASRENKCPCCEVSENHELWRCPKFLAFKVSERSAVGKRGKHCFCCLKVRNLAKECEAGFSCKERGLPDNRLLHVGREVQPKRVNVAPEETVNGTVSVAFGSEVTTVKGAMGKIVLYPMYQGHS